MRRKRRLSKWERQYSDHNTIMYFMNHYFKKEKFHDCVVHISMIDEYRGTIAFRNIQFDLRGWKPGRSDF